MITGLLFALAPRTPVAANDTKLEGNKFPPVKRATKRTSQQVGDNAMRTIKTVALAMTISGVALLSYASSIWSFDPSLGLKIQTASNCLTQFTGALS